MTFVSLKSGISLDTLERTKGIFATLDLCTKCLRFLTSSKGSLIERKGSLRPYTMISCPRKKIRLQHIFKDRGNLSCLQQEPLNALQLITWMLIKRYRAINYLAVSRWGGYSIKRTLITDYTFSLQNFLFSTKQPGPCFSSG